jgi:hypothetical protein
MARIVTLTLNPSIDGASQTESVRDTRKVRTCNETYDPGGGGINVARMIRELGGDAFAVYAAGGVTGPDFRRSGAGTWDPFTFDPGVRSHSHQPYCVRALHRT